MIKRLDLKLKEEFKTDTGEEEIPVEKTETTAEIMKRNLLATKTFRSMKSIANELAWKEEMEDNLYEIRRKKRKKAGEINHLLERPDIKNFFIYDSDENTLS